MYSRTMNRGRVRLFRLAACGLSTGLVLLAAELALRFGGLGYGSSPLEGHPVLHHWNPSNYRMRVHGPRGQYGGFDVYFNRQGMAMQAELPPASQPCLLFLGDSFTAARESPEEQRFCTLAAQELGVPAVNLGCSSFSPPLEALALETFGPQVRPRAVVLEVYANDLEGSAEMARIAIRDDEGNIVAVPGDRTPWYVLLGRKLYTVRLVNTAWKTFVFERRMKNRAPGGRDLLAWSPYFDAPLEESTTLAQRQAFAAGVLRVRDLCTAMQCPLLLVAVPDRGALRFHSADHFGNYVQELAAHHGIATLDLRSAFSQHDPGDLYFSLDIHFSAAGHQVVAQALVERLTELADFKRPIADPAQNAAKHD